MKIIVRLFLVLVAFGGILDAGYISYNKFFHIIPPCSPGFKCETVLTSPYASIGPIPLAYLGLVFYSLIFVLGVANFLEQKHVLFFNLRLHTVDLLWILSKIGFLFSLYLVFLMGVILNAWCFYCLISALVCLTNFILNMLHWRLSKGECECVASRPRSVFLHWLYVSFLKPIFFLFDAEAVHHLMVTVGEFLGTKTWGKKLTRFWFYFPGSTKKIDGIRFMGSVGLSAGFDYDARLTQILGEVGFGFMTIGTVTLEPYEGNIKPRLGRMPRSQALLVNKGFKSLGAEAVIAKLEPLHFKIPVGISIGSTNKIFANGNAQINDVITAFKLFEKSKVRHAYYELNISCPNTKGGQPFTTPVRLRTLLTALATLKIKRPVYIKMPIDLGERATLSLLKTADKFKIAGVIFGNLTKDKTNPDVHPIDRAHWEIVKGNLSGKPTWQRSNALIALTKRHFQDRFTIIGTGGIFSGEDALEKIRLGADLVQLITGMIYEGPTLIGDINHHIRKYSPLVS